MTGAADRLQAVLLVAGRDFRERVRERSFQVSSAVTLLILVAVAVVPAVVGGSDTYTVATAGPGSHAVVAAARAVTGKDLSIHERAVPDAGAARRLVSAGDADVAILDGRRLLADREPDSQLASVLQAAARQRQVVSSLRDAGLPPTAVREALAAPGLAVSTLHPQSAEAQQRRDLAFVSVFLLYGQLLVYGLWVALSIVEEKSSRVIEVLLAAVRPRQLLVGKVAGTGVLGLLQILLLGVVGVIAGSLAGSLSVPASAAVVVAEAALWFVLGYVFMAFVFAAVAATVSRQEDLQNATTPLTLLIVASFFVGMRAAGDPSSTLAVVLSYVPPFSPVVMTPRWAAGEVSGWQVLVAALIMLAAAGAMARLAARVYESSVLRIGAKVPLRTALRAARPTRSAG